MKKLYSVLLVVLIFSKANSQVNYAFETATGTYTSITGTSPTLTPSSGFPAADEGFANSIPIGFSFNYNGTVYTTVSLNTNGFLSFTNMVPRSDENDSYVGDDLSDGPQISSTVIRPIIAPFWIDLDLTSQSNLKYLTTGAAGSRIFTVEWANVRADYSAPAPVLSFQVKFYEATGVVEFIYRSEAGAFTISENENDGASIGITSAAKGAGTYLSLNNAGSSPTASSTVNTRRILTKPATGQIYRFTPTFTLPVTLLNFTGEKNNGIAKLKWSTSSEQNNKGFDVQLSLDGANYKSVGFVGSKSSTGSSSFPLQYEFDDVKAPVGNAYYRLKQIDNDGKSTYSSVVFLKGQAVAKLAIRNIYPNPTTRSLNLVIATPGNNKMDILVSDVTGRIVLRQPVQIIEGDNIVDLNVSKLSPGNYIIKAACNSGCENLTTKFVKQ